MFLWIFMNLIFVKQTNKKYFFTFFVFFSSHYQKWYIWSIFLDTGRAILSSSCIHIGSDFQWRGDQRPEKYMWRNKYRDRSGWDTRWTLFPGEQLKWLLIRVLERYLHNQNLEWPQATSRQLQSNVWLTNYFHFVSSFTNLPEEPMIFQNIFSYFLTTMFNNNNNNNNKKKKNQWFTIPFKNNYFHILHPQLILLFQSLSCHPSACFFVLFCFKSN